MKPLDLSKSQVEGLLQQVMQVTLGDLCDEADLSKCGVTTFVLGDGEDILRQVLVDYGRTDFFRGDLTTLAGTSTLRAIAAFTQREGLDTQLVMNYLHEQLGITIQGLIGAALRRYERTAADRQATSSVDAGDTKTDSTLEDTFYERVKALDAQRAELSAEMDAHFRPKVKALLEVNDLGALKALIDAMPACPTRMIIAGMYANHLAEGAHLVEHKSCNAL